MDAPYFDFPKDPEVLREKLLETIANSPLQSVLPKMCARAHFAFEHASLSETDWLILCVMIGLFRNPDEIFEHVLKVVRQIREIHRKPDSTELVDIFLGGNTAGK